MPNLFVYGTLREGENNHKYMKEATLLSRKASIAGSLVDTGNGYPGLLLENQLVAGEWYEVSEETLKRIDELEEYFGPGDTRNLFDRIECQVNESGGTHLGWTYVYNRDDYLETRFSDWKQYRLQHASGIEEKQDVPHSL
ncbi:gamma-glutamylcyclotransferase family protein [Paenibacillus chitinolyticus]|nr:gamma-glutamylcyclotransferase family protein [Paenibacillus chitinolyticus]MEC0244347.1 gamma-glutamylcyclotransferase [Paenibacillus chitinolyticus]